MPCYISWRSLEVRNRRRETRIRAVFVLDLGSSLQKSSKSVCSHLAVKAGMGRRSNQKRGLQASNSRQQPLSHKRLEYNLLAAFVFLVFKIMGKEKKKMGERKRKRMRQQSADFCAAFRQKLRWSSQSGRTAAQQHGARREESKRGRKERARQSEKETELRRRRWCCCCCRRVRQSSFRYRSFLLAPFTLLFPVFRIYTFIPITESTCHRYLAQAAIACCSQYRLSSQLQLRFFSSYWCWI